MLFSSFTVVYNNNTASLSLTVLSFVALESLIHSNESVH